VARAGRGAGLGAGRGSGSPGPAPRPPAGPTGGGPVPSREPAAPRPAEPDPVATDRQCHQLFWFWAGLHALLWIVVPAWVQPSGHRDVIELVNWGHHPAWGYWKHPPLQPWVADLAVRLAGGRLVGVYVAAQLSLTACLWAVWRLARDVLPPQDALYGVLLLEGILFYNYNSPKFNHDALQLPLWAWIGLSAWRAVTRGGLVPWLGL